MLCIVFACARARKREAVPILAQRLSSLLALAPVQLISEPRKRSDFEEPLARLSSQDGELAIAALEFLEPVGSAIVTKNRHGIYRIILLTDAFEAALEFDSRLLDAAALGILAYFMLCLSLDDGKYQS